MIVTLPQEYLDAQAKIDELDSHRVQHDYERHYYETAMRMKQAQAVKFASSTSSSTNSHQPTKSSSSVLVNLSQHLHGKLPIYQPEPIKQIATETVLTLLF